VKNVHVLISELFRIIIIFMFFKEGFDFLSGTLRFY
jgi:hypothetical protein